MNVDLEESSSYFKDASTSDIDSFFSDASSTDNDDAHSPPSYELVSKPATKMDESCGSASSSMLSLSPPTAMVQTKISTPNNVRKNRFATGKPILECVSNLTRRRINTLTTALPHQPKAPKWSLSPDPSLNEKENYSNTLTKLSSLRSRFEGNLF